jgi:hypothetical protein
MMMFAVAGIAIKRLGRSRKVLASYVRRAAERTVADGREPSCISVGNWLRAIGVTAS